MLLVYHNVTSRIVSVHFLHYALGWPTCRESKPSTGPIRRAICEDQWLLPGLLVALAYGPKAVM